MIDKKNIYAVVGASNNIEKYWYKVFKDLLDAWYQVIPINPKEWEILWQVVYPKLSAVKQKIDFVIFVVAPQITQKVLEEVKELWIKNVWMQPWSENNESIEICRDNWINCTYNACIMIQKNISSKKINNK